LQAESEKLLSIIHIITATNLAKIRRGGVLDWAIFKPQKFKNVIQTAPELIYHKSLKTSKSFDSFISIGDFVRVDFLQIP
jgi:hypothetical protein